MKMTKVRDELSGDVFEASEVLWTVPGRVPRFPAISTLMGHLFLPWVGSERKTDGWVLVCGATIRDDAWHPVEVLP